MTNPYRVTPVFTEATLPVGLRREHRTKAGTWGVIRVFEGELLLRTLDHGEDRVLTAGRPGLVSPGQPHRVAPLGPMRMQVEFYDAPPPSSCQEAIP
ncbi:MAG: DUF1971 domain-containing protein [Acetobacteraceae bacterium]|nr:DUF1971 domain-containing protein [Acetobacteraceae bacterium]